LDMDADIYAIENDATENNVADLPAIDPEPPKITVVRREEPVGIMKPNRRKHKKTRQVILPSSQKKESKKVVMEKSGEMTSEKMAPEKMAPEKKALEKMTLSPHVENVIHIADGVQFDAVAETWDNVVDINNVDLSQYDSLQMPDQAKKPREETDEWAEHFFDDHRQARKFQEKLANLGKPAPKAEKSVEPPQISEQYRRYHEGLVFDVDFFDPTHDATTQNAIPQNPPSDDDEPFIKGFFDDDEV